MPLPPPDSPFSKPIQNDLSKAMMEAMMRLPAVLAKQIEGQEGPVEVPPEQQAEAFRSIFLTIMNYLPQIAGKLDMLYAAVAELEGKVAELERQQRP